MLAVLLLVLGALSAMAQLTPHQTLPEYLDVGRFASFSIDGTPYLAIPDTLYIDPGHDDIIINIICKDYLDCYTPSKLYRWDLSSQRYEFFQDLVGCAFTMAFTFFVEDGINYLLCESLKPKSFLYSWNPSTESQFETYQNISLLSYSLPLETEFEFLQVESQSFLAVALPVDESFKRPGYIEILGWNATTRLLHQFQSIQPSSPPVALSSIVTSEGVGLIAFAVLNSNDDDFYAKMILHVTFFNATSQQFDEIQAIDSFIALDAQFFQIGTETFLVMNEGATPWPPVPNDDDTIPPVEVSVSVYRWNPSRYALEHIQTFNLTNEVYIGCTSVEIASSSYLVCTTTQIVTDLNFAYSDVYVWDPSLQQFSLFENFLTPAFAEKFSTFSSNGTTYLITSFVGGTGYNFTEVYEWKPINSTHQTTVPTPSTKPATASGLKSFAAEQV
eukprot:m.133387 g.133387  ORF g.133387 m.133387 type:complete len:445 (+) comp52408_c0_seq1:40-1374(+)